MGIAAKHFGHEPELAALIKDDVQACWQARQFKDLSEKETILQRKIQKYLKKHDVPVIAIQFFAMALNLETLEKQEYLRFIFEDVDYRTVGSRPKIYNNG